MSISTGAKSIEVCPYAMRQYIIAYDDPWNSVPMRRYEGGAPGLASIRRGHLALRRTMAEIGEIHLIDVMGSLEHGTRALKGVRFYGRKGEFLMEFPDLVLFGDGFAVTAMYDLLEEIGLDRGAIQKLYDSIRAQFPRREDGQGVEMYDYIMVAVIQ